MNKPSKVAMMLCFAGTLSLSLGSVSQNNLTKAETVSQQNEQINTDQKLVITAKEQTIVESMENAIPSHNDNLKYFQRQDGTGFFFQKVN